ncbi:GntR family transcriptional regulator [Pseudooceanicola sp.]|uniref:GntR family transcriptional regulator n=1 Tax=Pseudooceanicola sp. TaxID=1914328 RepID=UPI0026274958|nr:GntR family transcriptional regulator [Pseudooceanicola sp.]MDF1856588.1 GntR family transcriptional regulator [Pseudooceanicola sp.]
MPTRPESASTPPQADAGTGAAWAAPIVKENLADVAWRSVRAALMEGHLKPGEPLYLRPMSHRFGISVTPMREALVRLVSTNALSMDERGTVIVPALTQSEVREIWEIRAELEGRAAAAAAARVTAADIAALEALNGQIIENVQAKDFAAAVRDNTRFHLMLAALSHKPVLIEMIEGLWIRSGPLLWHAYDKSAPPWNPSKHMEIIDALKSGDAKAAYKTLSREVLAGMNGFLLFAEPESPQVD